MMSTDRAAAIHRETALLLRAGGCPSVVLRALRECSLTCAELAWMFRRKWRPRTVSGAVERLRGMGLAVWCGQRKGSFGGRLWRAV